MGRRQNREKILGPAGPLDPQLQTLSFIDELALVAIPAQIFTRIGQEMKHWSPARQTMVVELANTA